MSWHKLKSIVVIGETRSGKTSFCYHILEGMKKYKEIYVLNHPRKELILKLNYKVLHGLSDVERIQDCVLWIDEPQLHLRKYDRKNNEVVMRLLSLCGQKNITLVLSTSDTRFINKGLESYIDAFVVKDIDFEMIKQGSRIKKIIQKHCFIDTDGFNLKINEYIFDCRRYKDYNGKHTFKKPVFFNEEYSKPYYDFEKKKK